MAQQKMQLQGYIADFESLQQGRKAEDPTWLQDLRSSAIARFKDLGLPTARRGNEEWKYTNIGPLARVPFQHSIPGAESRISSSDLESFTFGEEEWSQLVFLDGIFRKDLSSTHNLPEGVIVTQLATAMVDEETLVQEHLANYAEYETKALTALNTAFLHDGAFVRIPDEISIINPIHLLFLTTGLKEKVVSYPRVLILAGRYSKATVIESYGGVGSNVYFTNAVAEIFLGDSSTLNYYKVQRQAANAYHIMTTQVTLGRDSHLSSVNVDLGGSLVRNNLNVVTAEEGASCMLNGVYLITGSQHVDNQVIIDHAKPHTVSRELYKGVLGGKSRSVFHGSIIVREGAVKVDAKQEDKNLLLSNEAEADTKPAFWIYCDDVKCMHGAACGQINENALFYLRSRGIDEQDARNLLTRSFVVELIESIEDETFRSHIDKLAMAKLEGL